MLVQCKPSMTFWVGYIKYLSQVYVSKKTMNINSYPSKDMNLNQKRH